jgi:hypothetical protein
MKRIGCLVVMLLLFASVLSHADTGMYISTNRQLPGHAKYVGYIAGGGVLNGSVGYTIMNRTNKPVNLEGARYTAVDKKGASFDLTMIYKPSTLDGVNMMAIQPTDTIEINCHLRLLQGYPSSLHVYLADGRRIDFTERGSQDIDWPGRQRSVPAHSGSPFLVVVLLTVGAAIYWITRMRKK